ncbi:MAG: hypothetical protein IPH57_16565 [Saprospiraceae bacterium]|nr:hypothetical protein [Saprospiraceae bacterium]
MLDRVKYIISSDGMNNLGIALMIFFFVLLIAIFIVTLKRKKSYDDYDARLPLEEDDYIETKN